MVIQDHGGPNGGPMDLVVADGRHNGSADGGAVDQQRWWEKVRRQVVWWSGGVVILGEVRTNHAATFDTAR